MVSRGQGIPRDNHHMRWKEYDLTTQCGRDKPSVIICLTCGGWLVRGWFLGALQTKHVETL